MLQRTLPPEFIAAGKNINRMTITPLIDTANLPWPTSITARQAFPVGRRVARLLPERWPAIFAVGRISDHYGSRPSTHARGGCLTSRDRCVRVLKLTLQ